MKIIPHFLNVKDNGISVFNNINHSKYFIIVAAPREQVDVAGPAECFRISEE